MRQFIRCTAGWVNLDYVARVRWDETNKGDVFTFENIEGTKLGTSTDYEEWMELTAQVVPAVQGETAYVVSVCNLSSERPVESDLFGRRVSVVAWRIIGGHPDPILMDPKSTSEIVLLGRPGSGCFRQGDSEYESVDEAKAAILMERQREWDAAHANKEPTQ